MSDATSKPRPESQYNRIQPRVSIDASRSMMDLRGNLFRMLNEVVVFLLGALLLLLSISGRLHVPRGSAAPLLVGAILIYWGARIGMRASPAATRVYDRLRAISFIAAGLTILNVPLIPYRYSPIAFRIAGGILALRGLAAAAYLARPKKAV
jgi:hypothetical protein